MSMEKKERKPWGSSRIAFLSQIKVIQERLEKGQPLSQIHRELELELDGMIYSQFTHYVRKHFMAAKRKNSTLISRKPDLQLPIPKEYVDNSPRFIPPDTVPDMSKYI